jgi:surfeit locus 1 family protein
MKNRIWPVLLASGLGLVVLLTLGFWQVQRLQWKETLIQQFDQAIAAEPTTLTQAADKPFAKIKARGTFSTGPSLRVLGTHQGGPAWELVQGFVTTAGENLLVVRGKQSHGAGDASAPAGEQAIVGFLREPPPRGSFDVDNDAAANLWNWWDAPAMAAQFAMTGATFVTLAPGSPGTEGLRVDPPKANLRNNHLGYAITWFGLAIVLIVMTALFVRSRMKNA